jgi:peptidoglycan lytic transglycosylase G
VIRRLLRRLMLLAVLSAIAAGGAAGWAYRRAQEPFQGFAGPEQFVNVPPGSGAAAVGDRLAAAGVVRDRWTFRVALAVTGRARELKAGEYRFDRPLSALDVVDKIARGEVHTRLLTFPEGLTIVEMARVFEERGFGKAADFQKASSDPARIAALDPKARDLEGYLFPESYALPRDTPAREVVRQMVDGFTRAFDGALRDQAAAAGLSLRQVVTLSSLVEKETARPEERPIVAAVYRNRLRIGMAMQADPTVIYALQKAGRFDGNLTRDDLQFDSPYNTYRYPGLPPGPIAAPGLAALRATVQPAEVNYLYFVSRNDGSHVFAATLAEHNRNVEEWQVKYYRQRRRSSGGS